MFGERHDDVGHGRARAVVGRFRFSKAKILHGVVARRLVRGDDAEGDARDHAARAAFVWPRAVERRGGATARSP